MREALALFIKQAFIKLGYEDYLNLTISQKSDYQINSVFEISKRFSKKPDEVGEELIGAIKDLNGYDNYIKDIEFALPGFINITVSDKLINSLINEMSIFSPNFYFFSSFNYFLHDFYIFSGFISNFNYSC